LWSGATEYAQRPPLAAFSINSSRKLEAARDTRLSTLWRVSVQCGILGTLLVALSKRRANTPAQDRTQLGVAEFVYGAMVVDCRVDYLHWLAFEAIGDLLERPALLVLDRALDKLLWGQQRSKSRSTARLLEGRINDDGAGVPSDTSQMRS